MKDEEKAKEILEKSSYDVYAERELLPDAPWTPCENLTTRQVRNMIYQSVMEMAEYKNAKMEKLRRLADEMYFRMQTLSTDLRPLRKAMEDYHNFIIHEYDE